MSKTLAQNEYNDPEYDIVWDDTGESLLHLLDFRAIKTIGDESSKSDSQPAIA
ncbi:MAG: hypothetical protein ACXAEN_16035 [Candidatus Thorarchaeota archaeon]|jgi:hypothetical protein